MIVQPCTHTFELRWDLDHHPMKLVGIDDQSNHYVRKWIVFYVWSEYKIKLILQLISF